MNKTTLYGAIALGVIVAGALYLNSADRSVETPVPAQRTDATSGAPSDTHSSGGTAAQSTAVGQFHRVESAPPADPRLAALAVSPPNDLIQFVVGDNGKVIAEIDKDPASMSFKKPLREYTYAGDRVIGLTAYHYFPGQIEISRIRVSYRPDGSVDDFVQATTYDDATGQR